MEPEGSLPCSQEPVKFKPLYKISLTSCFIRRGVLSPLSNSKHEDHLLSADRDCSYPPFWRPTPSWRVD